MEGEGVGLEEAESERVGVMDLEGEVEEERVIWEGVGMVEPLPPTLDREGRGDGEEEEKREGVRDGV